MLGTNLPIGGTLSEIPSCFKDRKLFNVCVVYLSIKPLIKLRPKSDWCLCNESLIVWSLIHLQPSFTGS